MSFPLLAKVFNSVVWTSHPLLLAEMSPTSVRNIIYGCVSFVGEIGSVLAPYLNVLVGRPLPSDIALNICSERDPRRCAANGHRSDVVGCGIRGRRRTGDKGQTYAGGHWRFRCRPTLPLQK